MTKETEQTAQAEPTAEAQTAEAKEPTPEAAPKEPAPKAEKGKAKKAKAEDKTAALLDELAQQKNLLLRTAAEFDNYKKRTERERLGVAEYAKAEQLKILLPIFDNVDRALSADSESSEYQKGLQMIVRQLAEAVQKLGLREIAAAGDPFDPKLHEAVMHVEDEALGENVVAEVLQKGYALGDTVVRPAMVKVAN